MMGVFLFGVHSIVPLNIRKSLGIGFPQQPAGCWEALLGTAVTKSLEFNPNRASALFECRAG